MLLIFLLIPFLIYLPGQEAKSATPVDEPVAQASDRQPFKCSQPAAEQDPLIREAVANQFRIRRVEFAGNAHTRDFVLRRRVMLNEGDVFTRENLVRGLKNVSWLKVIYPVKLSDVIIRLDRPEEMVDMTICFKEKRARRVVKRSPGKRAS